MHQCHMDCGAILLIFSQSLLLLFLSSKSSIFIGILCCGYMSYMLIYFVSFTRLLLPRGVCLH